MAYGSILDSIHKHRIKLIIEGSLPTLMNMLSDKSFDVRSTVSWVIKKICKFHMDVIIYIQNSNPNLLENFLQTIIKHFSSNKKVVMNLIEAVNFIAQKNKEQIGDNNFNTGVLSKYYNIILESFIKIAYMPEAISPEMNIAQNAFFTIGNLVEYCPFDVLSTVQGFFNQFINLLLESKEKEKFSSEENRLNYQEYLCSVISTYLMEEKIRLNMDQAKYIYNEVKGFFLERGTIFENGISLCSSIALNIGKEFKELISDFGNFLYVGLGMFNAENICKSAIMSVSDLIRALGSDFEPYIDQVFPIVINIIQVWILFLLIFAFFLLFFAYFLKIFL